MMMIVLIDDDDDDDDFAYFHTTFNFICINDFTDI